MIERWLWNPRLFFTEVFGFDLWEGQEEICEALKHHDHVATKSGHKTGKSRLVAGLAIWWAVTRPGGRSPMTSSSFFQVRKILWREVTMLYKMARVDLGGELHEDPRTGLIFPATNSEVFGFSTRDKERAAGISSPYNFYQVDEASGKQFDDLYETIQGNLAGGGKILLYSQATRTTGVFYDAFRNPKSPYHPITLNSEMTPNALSGETVIPGLATKKWVEERASAWGKKSSAYAVRVLGEFPRQSDEAIITFDMIHRAHVQWEAREVAQNMEFLSDLRMIRVETGPLYIGVDVAYFGNDEAVLFPRRGFIAMNPRAFRKKDGAELAGEILDFCQMVRETEYLKREKIVVNVDIIGVGVSCYDHLTRSERARMLEVLVFPINVSETPDDEVTYADFNTELRFKCAEWLLAGGCLPEDHLLEQEMLLPEYNYDEKLRLQTVYKDDKGFIHKLNKKLIRKLLGRSPDRFDGLMLSMYDNSMREFSFESDGSGVRRGSNQLNRFSEPAYTNDSIFQSPVSPGFLGNAGDSTKNFI